MFNQQESVPKMQCKYIISTVRKVPCKITGQSHHSLSQGPEQWGGAPLRSREPPLKTEKDGSGSAVHLRPRPGAGQGDTGKCLVLSLATKVFETGLNDYVVGESYFYLAFPYAFSVGYSSSHALTTRWTGEEILNCTLCARKVTCVLGYFSSAPLSLLRGHHE